MKSTVYLLSFVLVFSAQLLAQNTHCDCAANFKKLVEKTEQNYAGFPSKVTDNSRVKYTKLVQSIGEKAQNVTAPKACFYLLKEYVRFFADKHFTLAYSNPDDFDRELLSFSEETFKKNRPKKRMDAVEGIWVNADSTLKLAIQKFPGNVYKAIVLQSQDSKIPVGLVYFTLTPTPNGFKVKEYDSFGTTDVPAKQKGNLLQVWSFYMLGKIYPTSLTAVEQEELNTWKNNNNGLDFKKLSSKTAYLKVPTFMNNDDKIQQLVAQNDSIIKSCDYLIVDLTGNGGGNTGWVSFVSYFMTNPIQQYSTFLRVSPDNVKSKLADLEPFATQPIPDDYKKYFPDPILAAYKKAYQELPTTQELFYPIPGVTFPLDAVLKQPKKVALLVDDFCGSSAEYFFYLTKQSTKTTTYGIPTIGMMDYEGMSVPTPLPYANFYLCIPIVKSSWTDAHPIDPTGFQPDVFLGDVERQKWVEFVQQELER